MTSVVSNVGTVFRHSHFAYGWRVSCSPALPIGSCRLTLPLHVALPECMYRIHGWSEALIAAMAAAHGMAVVTGNVPDFAPTGVLVIDSWLSI